MPQGTNFRAPIMWEAYKLPLHCPRVVPYTDGYPE